MIYYWWGQIIFLIPKRHINFRWRWITQKKAHKLFSDCSSLNCQLIKKKKCPNVVYPYDPYILCCIRVSPQSVATIFSWPKNVATQESSIHIERMWHKPVNAAIRWALHTVATCRRQVNHTPVESWFLCLIVEYKVNMEHIVQY